MRSNFRHTFFVPLKNISTILVITIVFATSLLGQRPGVQAARPEQQRDSKPKISDPTFETLLGADTYKLYGEIRNLGQLLSSGGAGEIVDPILKLANPGPQFQEIVKFLRKNGDALASSRLLFATWPTRADVPTEFVAIEFATPEEAAKFSPKLETFLPTVLPPAPLEPDSKTNPAGPKPNEPGRQDNSTAAKTASAQSPKPATNEPKREAATAPVRNSPAERLPFVLSHTGNLVFISDRRFSFEKLQSPSSKALMEDPNFRVAHDRFANESVFLYFNVALEDRAKPSPTPMTVVTSTDSVRRPKGNVSADEPARSPNEPSPPPAADEATNPVVVGALQSTPEPPAPARNKEQQAQANASSQIGQMLELLGIGEPQWPDAVGLALVLDNNEYVLRAVLIEPPERRKLPLPFVPQLISGAALTPAVPDVLPDDTEVFVSASIDLGQTYEGMRKQAEVKAKAAARQVQTSGKEPALDTFAEFEKKAGFKIKEDLLPALGNEIAIASSLQTIESFGLFGPPPPKASPSPGESKADQTKNGNSVFPMVLIALKDRDTARRLLPHVLDGLGMGEANLVAQVEKHDDAEIVNYAGLFAYGFVGDFLVISEAATVRHVVEAWTNHQTLASNAPYRNFTRWEPRQSLGQIYLSPALMDGYRAQLNKQAPKMDAALRDLLMSLSPAPQAISYSLSNEGFGALHELHLPKDLVIAMVASTSASMSAIQEGSPETNELVAISGLNIIANSEETYKTSNGNGNYATLDKLFEEKMIGKNLFEDYGYKYNLTVTGDNFEVTATPAEYGKTGKRSFFVDKSRVVRGDDHGGGPATAGDKPVQP